MPLRTLGWLGAAACARSLVEVHQPFLDNVDIEQIQELVEQLLEPEQRAALQLEAELVSTTGSSIECQSSAKVDDSFDFSDDEEIASESAIEDVLAMCDVFEEVEPPSVSCPASGAPDATCMESPAVTTPRSSPCQPLNTLPVTWQLGENTYWSASLATVRGDMVLSGAYVHPHGYNGAVAPRKPSPTPRNVARLQASLERILSEQSSKQPGATGGPEEGCASPSSVLDFRPLLSPTY